MIIIGIPKSIIFTHLTSLNFSALNTKKVMTRFIIKYDSIMYFITYTNFDWLIILVLFDELHLSQCIYFEDHLKYW